MFIGEDWMVNLMIIYTKNIIAKVLDFDDIINFFMGKLAQWVQISQEIIKFDHPLKFENQLYVE